MLGFAEAAALPVHILLTKADKLSRGAAGNTLQAVRKAVKASSTPVTVQLFSSLNNIGVDELATQLDTWLPPPAA